MRLTNELKMNDEFMSALQSFLSTAIGLNAAGF
jgi:hypothetical protein